MTTTQTKPPQAAPSRPIRVLHLSNLHFAADAAWDQMQVLTELVNEVTALRRELGPIHRVVITGNIANYGTAKDYKEAAKWLKGPLAEAARVQANQIRMVPGNHDVDRKKINLAVSGLDEKVLSKGGDYIIAESMRDGPLRKMLLDRQAAYREFARDFNPVDDGPGWRSEEEIEGWAVHFIGLNTAWLAGSHKNDRGEVDGHRHLALGGPQWNALFPADRPDPDLTIALMHHPWEDLTEQASLAHRDATYLRCGVILRGHQHRVETLSVERDGQPVLEATAGACYADPREGRTRGFQLLELDPGVGHAKIHLRKWHSPSKCWISDRERYPKTAPDGIVELALRRSPRTTTLRATSLPSSVTEPVPSWAFFKPVEPPGGVKCIVLPLTKRKNIWTINRPRILGGPFQPSEIGPRSCSESTLYDVLDKLLTQISHKHARQTQTQFKCGEYACVLLLDDAKLLEDRRVRDVTIALSNNFRCVAVSFNDRPVGFTLSEVNAEKHVLHLPRQPTAAHWRKAKEKHVALLGAWANKEIATDALRKCMDIVLFVVRQQHGTDIWATSFSGRTHIKTKDLIDAVGQVATNQPLVIWNDARFRTEHEQLSNELPTSQDTEA
ncbi:metallophosphoesterase [Myxococcota bacterium]|nr:metallophosphoesterase [Myxococcota bacterium]